MFREVLINSILAMLAMAVPGITMAMYRILVLIAAKLHIEFTSQQEGQLRTLTSDAVLVAEEYAAAKVKAGLTKPTSDEKLSIAVDQLTGNLPTLTHKTAIDMIKGELPKLGLGAAFKSGIVILAMTLGFGSVAVAQDHTDIVQSVKQSLQARGVDLSGPCGAYAITKRVAWQLQAEGAGVLSKTGGNNCEGYSVDSIAYPDGRLFDILIDAGGANGPNWGANGTVDPARRVVVPVNPDAGVVSTPINSPIENGDIEARLVAMDIMLHDIQAKQAVLLDTLLKLRQAAIDQGKVVLALLKLKK